MSDGNPPPPPSDGPTNTIVRGKAPPSFKSNFEQSHDDNSEKPRFRSGGGRLFVGNLESEKVTKEEFTDIFSKYGQVVEVSLHRSYGFVQFAREDEMYEAMKGEQGREIGSRRIDIQKAKQDRRRNGNSNAGPPNKRRRDDFHDRSPPRSRARNNNHQAYSAPRSVISPPRNGIVVKIILLGEMQRQYAQRVGEAIGEMNVPWEVEMLDGRSLSQALRDAEENKSRYALIVGRDNVIKGTSTVKLLHLKAERGGRCPTYDLETDRLVELIVNEENSLGFTEAGQPRQITPAPYTAPQPHIQPAASAASPNLLAIQQQLNSITQVLGQVTTQQPVALNLPLQIPQAQPQHQASDLQAKILEQQTILQQQIQALKTFQNQSQNQNQPPNQPQPQSSYQPPPQPRAQPAPQRSSGASITQLADLSKLLSNLKKAQNR